MIDWEEAQARILALAAPVAVERLPLTAALGRYTAEPLHALCTRPATDLSAMDGYAIRRADVPGPWTVIGESAAGRPFVGSVAACEAVRISTGAALPDGTDAVLIQEDVVREGAALAIVNPASTGGWVRRTGSDFRRADRLLEDGAPISPATIALALMAGHRDVLVRRPIEVAILSTGDELARPDDAVADHQIPDANGPMIEALLAPLPVRIRRIGPVADDRSAIDRALNSVRDADVIVTIGGASVGDHDLIQSAFKTAGAALDFWKIAMQPGKPLLAGELDDAVVLGLPGNPVSAFVTAVLFLKPLIARLAGAAQPLPPRITAGLGDALPARGVRAEFPRMRWQHGRLVGVGQSDSGLLRALPSADALAVRPAHSPPAQAGDDVEAILLA